ncbi:MAG: hypothetical protein ACI4JB_04925 [Porcipelethomonas sp.]
MSIFQELKNNFVNGWLKEDPRIVIASLLGILTVISLFIALRYHCKKIKKLKQTAIKNGTVITAVLKSKYHYHGRDRKQSYSGRYKYTVDGIEREYSIRIENPVPDTIELYPKNSRMTKFFSDYDRTSNADAAFNILAGIAVCVITLLATGYISI